MERIKAWFKGDPILTGYKEYEREESSNYNLRLAQRQGLVDIRLLKLFGDRFSPEAYARVSKYFPATSDGYSNRLNKFDSLLLNWPHKNEVFFQRYGSGMLSLSVAFSALYMTVYFRSYFRLQHYARFTMYLTSIYFPSVAAGIYNQFHISNYIIRNGDSCTMCLALNSSLVQMLTSTVYPFIFACGMGMFYSTKYLTYKFPLDVLASRKSNIKAAKLIWKVMNFRKGMFLNVCGLIIAFNTGLGYYVSEQQQKETYGIYRTCLEHEEQLIKNNLPSRPPSQLPMIVSKRPNN